MLATQRGNEVNMCSREFSPGGAITGFVFKVDNAGYCLRFRKCTAI